MIKNIHNIYRIYDRKELHNMIVKNIKIYCNNEKCPYLSYCDSQKQKGFCMRPECPSNDRRYVERGTIVQRPNRNDYLLKKIYEPDLKQLGVPLL